MSGQETCGPQCALWHPWDWTAFPPASRVYTEAVPLRTVPTTNHANHTISGVSAWNVADSIASPPALVVPIPTTVTSEKQPDSNVGSMRFDFMYQRGKASASTTTESDDSYNVICGLALENADEEFSNGWCEFAIYQQRLIALIGCLVIDRAHPAGRMRFFSPNPPANGNADKSAENMDAFRVLMNGATRIYSFNDHEMFGLLRATPTDVTDLSSAVRWANFKDIGDRKGCCADRKGCCADRKGCCADPKGCCADPKGCCADPKGCCADPKGCCAESTHTDPLRPLPSDPFTDVMAPNLPFPVPTRDDAEEITIPDLVIPPDPDWSQNTVAKSNVDNMSEKEKPKSGPEGASSYNTNDTAEEIARYLASKRWLPRSTEGKDGDDENGPAVNKLSPPYMRDGELIYLMFKSFSLACDSELEHDASLANLIRWNAHQSWWTRSSSLNRENKNDGGRGRGRVRSAGSAIAAAKRLSIAGGVLDFARRNTSALVSENHRRIVDQTEYSIWARAGRWADVQGHLEWELRSLADLMTAFYGFELPILCFVKRWNRRLERFERKWVRARVSLCTASVVKGGQSAAQPPPDLDNAEELEDSRLGQKPALAQLLAQASTAPSQRRKAIFASDDDEEEEAIKSKWSLADALNTRLNRGSSAVGGGRGYGRGRGRGGRGGPGNTRWSLAAAFAQKEESGETDESDKDGGSMDGWRSGRWSSGGSNGGGGSRGSFGNLCRNPRGRGGFARVRGGRASGAWLARRPMMDLWADEDDNKQPPSASSAKESVQQPQSGGSAQQPFRSAQQPFRSTITALMSAASSMKKDNRAQEPCAVSKLRATASRADK